MTTRKAAKTDAHNEWRKFTIYLKNENRFVLNSRWRRYVERIVEAAPQHAIVLKKGASFYRARIHDFESFEVGYTMHDMGPPPAVRTRPGRLNPDGLPCLYLASDVQTAVAEVRPWLGARLTIAEFVLASEVRILDLTERRSTKRSRADHADLWREINAAFAVPYHPEDRTGYLPTQYLAEHFKHRGFEGIKYGSALEKRGYNLALFAERKASPRKLSRMKITRIRYFYSGLPTAS